MFVLGRSEQSVRLKPEITEDLWHLEKLVSPGDLVSGSTWRKFVADSGRAERKPLFIKLRVEKVEFHRHSGKLRVLGIIVESRPEEFAPLGQHHSLDVDTGDAITVEKERWKKYELDRLREAQAAAKRPKLGVLIMDERDAEFFIIREYGIEGAGSASTEGGKYVEERKDIKNKWYSEIAGLMKQKELGQLVVAGPGFEKDNLMRFLKDREPALAKKILVESTGNTGQQAVYELVTKGTIDKIVKESRFADETKMIEQLVYEISREKPKAAYGPANVRKALEYGAVDKLLVVDKLLFENRAKLEPLLDLAERHKAKVVIVSSENEVSRKLEAFGGIAGLLRFAVE
jgi:protein pelota